MDALHHMRDAARWVGISVAGLALVVAGIIMLFTPGPGIAAILAGLAIWARQFRWARRHLEGMLDRMHARREKLPTFAARFLDERLRRRAIRDHAEAVARGEDPGPLEIELPTSDPAQLHGDEPPQPAAPADDVDAGSTGVAREADVA